MSKASNTRNWKAMLREAMKDLPLETQQWVAQMVMTWIWFVPDDVARVVRCAAPEARGDLAYAANQLAVDLGKEIGPAKRKPKAPRPKVQA